MSTNCIQSVEIESISISMIKEQYPAYYRAWRTMLNYGKNEVSVFWRGTHGLMVFIEDTLELENSPSKLPQYTDYIKLKRIEDTKLFMPSNVAWKISKVAARNTVKNFGDAEKELDQYTQLVQKSASIITQEVPVGVEKYRRTEDKESRLEELFTKSMEGTLSKSEELELEVLSKVVVEPTVEICSTDIEEFYNKRWSDL